MNFLFNLCNHTATGQRSLEDVIGIVSHQLQALGHNPAWATSNDKLYVGDAGVNVIVEGFTPAVTALVAEYRAKGARFLCLATEEPTERGFNHGRDPEMVRRQAEFPNAMRHFEGILHLVPGERVRSWYAQHAPTAYVELGHARTLVRAPSRAEPAFDFGFYGSLSPRRLRILKKLARAIGSPKAVRVVADFATQVERDEAMRDAKVVVQIRKFDEMGLVSSSRCNTALCLGRPVVAEPHLLSKPWDEIVRFADTLDGFYAEALVVRAAWRGVHAAQFAKFESKLTPEFCVGRALREIGLKGIGG